MIQYSSITFHLIILFFWSIGHNGTIDGQGQSWWIKYRQKLLNYTRGPLVQIMWSSNIRISNITLQNPPFWTLHPFDCKNVTITNVTILAPLFDAPNTDGIDPGEHAFLTLMISFSFSFFLIYWLNSYFMNYGMIDS